ncbi:MAG: YraN family protein, partial [Candidatus Nealsonbacteria bacterium]|nr:YraN family protein [Candidatus Nealsonbacteria bacterium]
KLGEKIAEDYLRKKRYRILDKNFLFRIPGHPQKGEIDIVARPRRNVFDILQGKKEDVIHFIEVKTLSSDRIIFPEEKVNYFKQKKLIKTAQFWLQKNKIPLNSKWQIDIISIIIDFGTKKAKIKFYKNIVS